MPKVGERYRNKHIKEPYSQELLVVDLKLDKFGIIEVYTFGEYCVDKICLEQFMLDWEKIDEGRAQIPPTNQQEKSPKIPYDENILQSTGDSFIDYKCSCGNIIRLKIPYQKSLEVDKAKSIWKNVGELPEQNCHVIIQDYSDRYSIFECAEKRLTNILTGIYAREDKIVKKFCTLTDFINAFEDLQERVRKLEEKK